MYMYMYMPTHDASAAIEHDSKHLLEAEHSTDIGIVLSVVALFTTTAWRERQRDSLHHNYVYMYRYMHVHKHHTVLSVFCKCHVHGNTRI